MYKRTIELFVSDIKEAIEAIFAYIKDEDFDSFVDDRKTYSAVIREFEIIGEAVKHIPKEITNKYSNINWRDIQDFRNILIHEYFGVDFEIVWNTIHNDLLPFYEAIRDIQQQNGFM